MTELEITAYKHFSKYQINYFHKQSRRQGSKGVVFVKRILESINIYNVTYDKT